MKPGIYGDISNNEYHSGDGVSKTSLDKIAKSPAHYLHHLSHKSESTPAMDIGTATHTLILEPEKFDDEIAVLPDGIDRRTKAGKAAYAEFQEVSAGKVIIKADEFDAIQRMRDAVMAHPSAAQLLTGGIAEQSAYWVDEDTGMLCRCRPDFTVGRVLLDLKTTDDASPVAFGRSAAKYRYEVQGAFYLDGMNAAGANIDEFAFIVVEKKPPYAVAVYVMEPDHFDAGRIKYNNDLATLKDAVESDSYKGYGDEPQPLLLPKWALD